MHSNLHLNYLFISIKYVITSLHSIATVVLINRMLYTRLARTGNAKLNTFISRFIYTEQLYLAFVDIRRPGVPLYVHISVVMVNATTHLLYHTYIGYPAFGLPLYILQLSLKSGNIVLIS